MNDKHQNIEDCSPVDYPILIFETYEHISDGLIERIKKTVIKGRRDVATTEANLELLMVKNNSELIIIGIHDHKQEEINKIERIRKTYPEVNIMVLAFRANKEQQEKFKKIGVKGFINYGMSNAMREQAILTVKKDGLYFELLDGNQHKGTDSERMITKDVKLTIEHRIIIKELQKFKTPEEIAGMKGVVMGAGGIKKLTERLRATYDTKTTDEAFKIMKERGLL